MKTAKETKRQKERLIGRLTKISRRVTDPIIKHRLEADIAFFIRGNQKLKKHIKGGTT